MGEGLRESRFCRALDSGITPGLNTVAKAQLKGLAPQTDNVKRQQ